MLYGHSYFGIGKLISHNGNAITLDFGFPYGVKTVKESEVQLLVEQVLWGLGTLH